MKTEICLNDNFEITNSVTEESGRISINPGKNNNFCRVEVVFEKSQCDLDRLLYVFYGREFVMSEKNCHYKCEYGFMYPFSMIGFMSGDKAITIIADSHKIGFIEIEKNDELCRCAFGFEHCLNLPVEFLLFRHTPSLSAGIEYYRNWYVGKFGKLPKCKKEAEDIFHVRRYFFNEELCTSHILDRGNVLLEKIYQNDCEKLGGIDAGLLFDFAFDKTTRIRCGNSTAIPFSDESLHKVQKQIKTISKTDGCRFFCYFDPYLVQDGSDADKLYKEQLPVLKRDGSICYIWDKMQWPPCVGTPEWKKFSLDFISQSLERLCCDGVYLDEFGNGTQYNCYNPNHNHPAGFTQTEAEAEYVSSLQEQISGKMWMCEFPPPDYAPNNMDVALSDTASLINIYRFIFTGIKFVRITGCDRPLGDNVWEVNKSFFNGEGLWIDNNINDSNWYSDKVKEAIRNQYLILKKYKDFFNSDTTVPLIYKNEQGIFANKFVSGDNAIVTFINASESDFCGEIRLDGMTPLENLYDETEIVFNDDSFKLSIKSKAVGCLFLKLNKFSKKS